MLACTAAADCLRQRAIREFLKIRTSYDVLPLSFRLIVLDVDLLIKKSLAILIQNSEAASALLFLPLPKPPTYPPRHLPSQRVGACFFQSARGNGRGPRRRASCADPSR